MDLRQLPILCGLLTISLFGAAAQAQTFPNKPLTIVVPAPAEAVVEALNKHARASLAKPEVRADIEQRGSTISPDRTPKQEQDDYLKEIQIYTAISKSVRVSPQ